MEVHEETRTAGLPPGFAGLSGMTEAADEYRLAFRRDVHPPLLSFREAATRPQTSRSYFMVLHGDRSVSLR
jgi:hypothetical protein